MKDDTPPISLRQYFVILVKRDLKLSVRVGGGGLMSAAFLGVVVTLVPFGVGPLPDLLSKIAPGIIWVGVLLSSLLSLERLFQTDFEDGSFELLYLQPFSLTSLVIAKVFAFWIATALPLILMAPVLSVLLNQPPATIVPLVIALLIGTPALSMIGAIGAALTVGLRRGGLLLSLLSLPLCIPTLIFGVGSVSLEAGGGTNLLLLLATTLVSFVVGPLAAAGGLKLNLT